MERNYRLLVLKNNNNNVNISFLKDILQWFDVETNLWMKE